MDEIIYTKKIPDSTMYVILASIIFGFMLFAINGYDAVSSIFQNSSKQKLVVLTKTHIEFPAQPEHWFTSSTPDIIIPWDKITRIHLEHYETGGRHKTYYRKLYFYTSEEKVAQINSKHINVSMLEFFTEIRKFYHGEILREYKRGVSQVLKETSDGLYEWGNTVVPV